MSRNRMSVRRITGPRSTRLLLPAVVAGLLLSAAPAAQATSAPSNDNFAQATPLTLSNAFTTQSTVGATTEAGEAPVLGRNPAASVWFTFTPTASGHVIFRTEGSSFDTVLAAYVGSTADSAALVTANDDATFDGVATHQSRIDFDATVGTTYRISVGGYTAYETGTLDLSWASNDSFTAPLTLLAAGTSGQSFVLSANNDGATLEPAEPLIGKTPGGASEWFSWTPTFTGSASFATQWSNFTPLIGVYTGNTLASLKQVQVGGGSVAFPAVAGQTYRIAVQGALGGALQPTGVFGLRYSSTMPLVSIASTSTVEGNSGSHAMPFTVKLSSASAGPVGVTYTTASSTAKAGSDYVGKSGTVTFAPGQTTATVNVMVTGDTTKEADETMQLKLTAITTGNALFSNSAATGTIKNDD